MEQDLLQSVVRGRVRINERLAQYTTFRIGGPCQFLFEPVDVSDLQIALTWIKAHHIPFLMIGSGANMLVKDGGYHGLVIRLSHPFFCQMHIQDTLLRVGAGTSLAKLLHKTVDEGLSGMEFMAGIPGTVGGALRMNAGAFGGQMSDGLVSLTMLDVNGKLYEYTKEKCGFAYRKCETLQNGIAVEAVFKLTSSDSKIIKRKIAELEAIRGYNYPNKPTAGCFFKNPEGFKAGKIIDELGLKNMSCGGAKVSLEHGNFIINQGQATAQDVLGLVEKIKKIVYEKNHIHLEYEVIVVGDDMHE